MPPRDNRTQRNLMRSANYTEVISNLKRVGDESSVAFSAKLAGGQTAESEAATHIQKHVVWKITVGVDADIGEREKLLVDSMNVCSICRHANCVDDVRINKIRISEG